MPSNARAAVAPAPITAPAPTTVTVPAVAPVQTPFKVSPSLFDGLIRIGLMALALLCPPLFKEFTAGIEMSPEEYDAFR
jgi:hypothetical protein